MKKVYSKLIALSLILLISVSMVVVSSYAWLVISGSPEVSGIQVTIGGGNTILIAADIAVTEGGMVYHYPDQFSETLDIGSHESYGYLGSLGGLIPVSTVDGVNWFVPSYYGPDDPEVRGGRAVAGQMKNATDFELDNSLTYANTEYGEEEKPAGNYYYIDFWVVSPGAECTLRVSTGEDSGGSFVVDLHEVESAEDGFVISEPQGGVSSMVRVGFLANTDTVVDNSMVNYQSSEGFDERYRILRGVYAERGENLQDYFEYDFTIYEPNGDYHPNEELAENGTYVPTKAIGIADGTVTTIPVTENVTVQKHSTWSVTADGTPEIEQIFRAAIYGKNLDSVNVLSYFYNTYLQGQFSSYLDKGVFIQNTSDIGEEVIGQEQFIMLDTANATDDVFIVKLQRNVPQRIRMFIWVEGQDADCARGIAESSFAMSIEFAGSTEENDG